MTSIRSLCRRTMYGVAATTIASAMTLNGCAARGVFLQHATDPSSEGPATDLPRPMCDTSSRFRSAHV